MPNKESRSSKRESPLFFEYQFKNQVIRCRLARNNDINSSHAFYPDCSHFFVFELQHRNKTIYVRSTPEDMYHLLSDYHIAKRKSLRQYAEEFAFQSLSKKDKWQFRNTFWEVDVDSFSDYARHEDGLEFIANQIITCGGGGFAEEKDSLIEYLKLIHSLEQKICAGQVSYPVYVIDDDHTSYEDAEDIVWPNRSLTLSYKPYLETTANPTPWRFSAKIITLRMSKDYGDCLSREETKPISIHLTNKQMDTMVSGIRASLESMGFEFSNLSDKQYFTTSPHQPSQKL